MTSPAAPEHRGSDLDSREEIAELVRRFYQDVAQDDLLGPMFNDVAQVDWSEHLPKLTAFWCRVLLGIPGFAGNAFSAHIEVDEKRSIELDHFQRWLDLFQEHVDFGWSGPLAEQAKAFARRVGMAHSSRIVGTPYEHVPDAATSISGVEDRSDDEAPSEDDGRRRIPVFGTPGSQPG